MARTKRELWQKKSAKESKGGRGDAGSSGGGLGIKATSPPLGLQTVHAPLKDGDLECAGMSQKQLAALAQSADGGLQPDDEKTKNHHSHTLVPIVPESKFWLTPQVVQHPI